MNLIPYRRKSNISRSSPLDLIEDLQSDLYRLFDSSLLNFPANDQFQKNWLPHTDIHDMKDKLVIKTDLPGMEKEDIEVSIEGNTLFIKGEKKHEEKVQDSGCLRSERFFGHFERSLPLTEDIDTSKVDASFKNGVLTLNIPKHEGAKPKQIKVKVQ